MAQQKHKRKRRHRGTQAGTIEARGRTSRPSGTRSSSGSSAAKKKPANRTEARQMAQQKRAQRFETPPTWRGSLNRAAFAAALFGVLMIALGRPIVQALILAGLMVFMYLPLSYYTDRFLYTRYQRRKNAAKD
jgi:hypothetical protein